jgi:tight adherence protein B
VIELLAGLAILAIGGAVIWIVVRGQLDLKSRRRLAEYQQRNTGAAEELAAIVRPRPALPRYRIIPWLLGILLASLLYIGLAWPPGFAIASGIVFGLLGWQVEEWWHARTVGRLEEQLADAIDLMVAAVKAGSSLQGSLESAASSSNRPLKPQLEEVVGRIRFGDDPTEALTDMEARIPLETVRLFSITLAVNWQVGGRLAQTLANVGRTIRDRIELSRRMHAMTTQARVSVISIMGVTYFLAALMWRNDPSRMVGFLTSTFGQGATIAAVVLQAIGVAWISRMSRVKF